MATKRKVFVAYHHGGDQRAVDKFVKDFSEDLQVFTDHSVERAADSTDVDYLARVCRDRITGTSATIVMVGRQTGGRKFVDWEIMDTLRKEHGLVGMTVPGLDGGNAWVPDRLSDNQKTGYAKWYRYPSSAAELRQILDQAYYADSRLVDNSRSKRLSNSTR